MRFLILALAIISCSSEDGGSDSGGSGNSFADSRDGKKYKYVTIGEDGELDWMAENLNHSIGENWCYNNDPGNCDKYGKLYDWETAKIACPSGWELPGRAEWDSLARNISKFSAQRGGSRTVYSAGTSFMSIGKDGNWWTADEFDSEGAYYKHVGSENNVINGSYNYKTYGFSVRCVRKNSLPADEN